MTVIVVVVEGEGRGGGEIVLGRYFKADTEALYASGYAYGIVDIACVVTVLDVRGTCYCWRDS